MKDVNTMVESILNGENIRKVFEEEDTFDFSSMNFGDLVLDKMNTDVLPLLDVGSYGGWVGDLLDREYDNISDEVTGGETSSDEQDKEIDSKFEEWKKYALSEIASNGEKYLQKAFDVLKVAVTVVKDSAVYSSPKFYNYTNDVLEFTIKVSGNWLTDEFNSLITDKDFERFLTERFKSYSGFISMMPNTLEKFYKAAQNKDKIWQVVCVIVDYYASKNESELKDIQEKFEEYCLGNI